VHMHLAHDPLCPQGFEGQSTVLKGPAKQRQKQGQREEEERDEEEVEEGRDGDGDQEAGGAEGQVLPSAQERVHLRLTMESLCQV